MNFQVNLKCICTPKTWKVKELFRDLIFYYSHNPCPKIRFVIRVLGIHNFAGRQGRSLFNVYPISEWSILPFGFNPTCFNSVQIYSFLFQILLGDRPNSVEEPKVAYAAQILYSSKSKQNQISRFSDKNLTNHQGKSSKSVYYLKKPKDLEYFLRLQMKSRHYLGNVLNHDLIFEHLK